MRQWRLSNRDGRGFASWGRPIWRVAGAGLIAVTIGLLPQAGARAAGLAAGAVLASGHAGTDIGNAAQLTGTASGSLASSVSDDWWVVYAATPGSAVAVTVKDSASASSACNELVATLYDTTGTKQAVSGATLGGGASKQIAGSTIASDRYFVEVRTGDCDPAAGEPVTYTLTLSSGGGGTAPDPASGSATPGKSIGDAWPPLQGATSYNGTAGSGADENWYVLFKKPGTSAVTIRVEDTTVARSVSCPGVTVTLDNADGGKDVLSGAILGDNSAVTISVPTPGTPDYLGRYYLEITGDGCPTGGATYRIEPEPGSGWVSPARPKSEPLPSGSDRKAAGGPLTGGVTYDAALANAGTQDWVFFQASGSTPLTISVQDTTSIGDNCLEETVTLLTGSSTVSGVELGDDDGTELVADTAKTFYLEISVGGGCTPEVPMTAHVTLTPPGGTQSCSCSCGAALESARAGKACLKILAQTFRTGPAAGPASDVTNGTFPVMVGEKIKLTAQSQTAAGTSSPAATWTIPRTSATPPSVVASFGDGSRNLNGAEPRALTNFKTNPITFYVADAGTRTLFIQVSAMVSGKRVTAQTTLAIYTPTLTKSAAAICQVAAKNRDDERPVVAPGVFLGLNDKCGKRPGIGWELRADVPRFTGSFSRTVVSGELGMSQIINITATGTLSTQRHPVTVSTKGQWCSDSWPLYGRGTKVRLTDKDPTVSVRTAGANPLWQSLDTPGLGGLAHRSIAKVSGQFRDFVLYQAGERDLGAARGFHLGVPGRGHGRGRRSHYAFR